MTTPNSDLLKLRELISGLKVAMMTTIGEDGVFHSRPMWTQKSDFDGSLWFFTRAHSPKAMELLKDGHVALSYCDADENRYVAITGRARLVQDRKKAEALWSPMYQAWFPKGLDDPELALLEVTIEKAEYWDTPSSKVVQLVGLAQAALTDKPKLDLAG